MEIVEIDANLVQLDIVGEINDIGKDISDSTDAWNKKNILDTQEFRAILAKTEEWNLLDEETRALILEALNDQAVKKIFKIIILTHTVGGAATWIVAGSGIMELVSSFSDGKISVEKLLTSQTFLLYISKLVGTALIPYIVWRNDQVKNKLLKSATNGVPLLGSWVFPAWALLDQNKFFKFWKIYGQTKKAYRDTIPESATEQQINIFKEQLITACHEKFPQ